MTYDQRITGSRGSKLLITGTNSSLGAYCFIAQEDTVISSFLVNGVEARTEYGIGGNTLKAGGLITVPENDAITEIVITSGSVIIYNG